jgi:predicted unusual protein kinase regulating ubiquinone biosynthesis (AarF/ABC1/UbiB family)
MEIGRLVLELTRISGEAGVRMPAAVMVVGKMLVNLDEVGRELAPNFDPNASIRRHSTDMMRRKVLKMVEPQQLFSTIVETKKFLERLPGRIDHLLGAASDNRLRLRIDAIDEDRLIEGFQKIANRITVGLILGSLILGAAILMNVGTESTFTILGYPGLAMICFAAAAGGGAWLVISTFLTDTADKRRK